MRKSGQLIFITGVILFILMLGSLLMMSNALQDSSHFSDFYLGLLIFNTLGLLILVILISLNLKRLIKQLRNRIPGARMTIRMVAMFTVLSVTPVLVVYYFSLDFLIRGIDNWFDLRVEQALNDSLDLSRQSLDTRMRDLSRRTAQMAEELSDITDVAMPFEIDDMRIKSGAKELTLLTRQGAIISSSADDPFHLVPDRPNETILLQLQQGSSYAGLDTLRNDGLHIRVVVNIPIYGMESEARILQALYPVSGRINQLAESVQDSFIKYKELSYLREQLKKSFVIILTLVLLFSIFTTVWAAFYSARRLAEPVRNLARGTQDIAEGKYTTQLPVPSDDELGFLVSSFNDMTRKIAQAQDAANRSQYEAETQKSYLEAVLGTLSSGVLVLDQDNNVRTSNNSTEQILGIPVTSYINHSIDEIADQYPAFKQLKEGMEPNLASIQSNWREQIAITSSSGRKILMCSGTTLPGTHNMQHGHVIVIDDITALIQGQRNAAWSEMARRLAHEIKNPLTPIQLATERLRHKYLRGMRADDTETFDRLTNTIIQQVETMKDMVNSFTDFSTTPEINLQVTDINELLREIIDLYANLDSNAEIITSLSGNIPLIAVDKSRLRQVFSNLLKNAFDACDKCKSFRLEISSECITEDGQKFVEIKIKDSGSGVTEDIMDRMFDPYATTKIKGTGLGLAIVKKIVEEHKGLVSIINNPASTGACAIVRLPVNEVYDQNSNNGPKNRKAV
jgi:nitrogen fixation/metabolism regulation signal transduction histidine kinase